MTNEIAEGMSTEIIRGQATKLADTRIQSGEMRRNSHRWLRRDSYVGKRDTRKMGNLRTQEKNKKMQ